MTDVPIWLLVTLVLLALPTFVLVVWVTGEYLILGVIRRSRLWPTCGVKFEPDDDPDYRTACVRKRWHNGKHDDGNYLFVSKTGIAPQR